MKRVLMLTVCTIVLGQPALAHFDAAPASKADAVTLALSGMSDDATILLAKHGSDDGPDHDANDDKGGDRDDDDDDRDNSGKGSSGSSGSSDDDDDSSGSGRSKPRIPGGSGCDDAGDVAEHADCQV